MDLSFTARDVEEITVGEVSAHTAASTESRCLFVRPREMAGPGKAQVCSWEGWLTKVTRITYN